MASISGADLPSVFVAFLSTASHPALVQPFPPAVLRSLGDVIAADWVQYFEMRRPDRLEFAYVRPVTSFVEPGGIDEALELGLLRDNPIGAFKWGPADGPQRLSAMASPRRAPPARLLPVGTWRRSASADRLKVWLWSSDTRVACIVLSRWDGEFSERDRAVMEVLQQHLVEIRAAWLVAGHELHERRLTTREAQVVTWAAAGRQTHEIAELLGISPATARKHLEHAYEKLEVHGRSEAVAKVMRLSSSVTRAG